MNKLSSPSLTLQTFEGLQQTINECQSVEELNNLNKSIEIIFNQRMQEINEQERIVSEKIEDSGSAQKLNAEQIKQRQEEPWELNGYLASATSVFGNVCKSVSAVATNFGNSLETAVTAVSGSTNRYSSHLYWKT
ncbi:hypothetical protein [Candidatus Protochlamydia sp. W-9]|uniref:hypothetical protein n=1 Tax=Candidatus Protochlamydia sp. W-9 TaxID=1785087 RepID=UPI00096A3004|nr:hypothetical protein [Candidatus Protochlamydia sp. W-9]